MILAPFLVSSPTSYLKEAINVKTIYISSGEKLTYKAKQNSPFPRQNKSGLMNRDNFFLEDLESLVI